MALPELFPPPLPTGAVRLTREQVLQAADVISRYRQGDPEVSLLLAWVSAERQDHELAMEAAEKVLAARPNDGDAWFLKATLFATREENEAALAAADRALEHGPGEMDAWTVAQGQVLRGRIHANLLQWEKAVDDLRPGLLEHADDDSAWFSFGVALDQLGQREASIEAYDRVIAMQPAHAAAWFNRACEYAILGRKEEALADLREAMERDPHYAEDAKGDDYFKPLWQDEDFLALVGG